MDPFLLLCCLLFPSYTFAVQAINDTKRFPICIDDSDCEKRNLDGYACFQYFCYPWDNKPSMASDPPRPLELCRKDKDCPKMLGGPAKCFKHYDRRRVTHGVCVPSIDRCDTHDDCYAKGGKCCNGHCCNEEYFVALGEMPCFNDLGCKVRPHIDYRNSNIFTKQSLKITLKCLLTFLA